MLCKVFDSKYERVVTSLIQNLILSEVFESKSVFFPKIISLRIKLSKTARNWQLCCFYTVRWSQEIDFLERMLQWILIFFIHFCFKILCIVKFRFTFWRVLKRLIRNLTRFKKFYSKFDELLKVGSNYDSFKPVVSKSYTFWKNFFKNWSFSKDLIEKKMLLSPNFSP